MEDEKRIEEIKDLLTVESEELKKEVSIVFDGKQYTIRIPKNLADKISLNPKVDKFLFRLNIPSKHDKQMRLIAELIKNEE